MKIRKILTMLIIFAISVCSLAACSAMGDGDPGGYKGDYSGAGSGGSSMGIGSPSYDTSEGGAEGDVGGDPLPDADGSEDKELEEDKTPEEDKTDEEIKIPAGLITAGAQNDNEYFKSWQKLFDQGEDGNGKFFSYSGDKSWGFSSYRRIKVSVTNGEDPVAGAKVVAENENRETLFRAVTDATGTAYLFLEGAGRIIVSSGDFGEEAEFTNETVELSLNLDGNAEKKNIIDLMFVVDVTGSMGDELSYLKAEIGDVIGRICANDTDTVVNLALLFYRDDVDEEQFSYHDFVNATTDEGLAYMQNALNAQRASGGGDYPESVDEALAMAMEKQWSSGATTKIIFHVLDAPPHSTQKDQERYNAAVMSAAKQGIRICPILCSGAAGLTEYLTRQAAIYTGGTFIFVTDDSGIGGSHHDPDLPNVTVEALNSLMVRLVKGYHTGVFDEPVYWKDEIKNQTAE